MSMTINRGGLSVTKSLIILNVIIFLVGMVARQEAVFNIACPGGRSTSTFEVLFAYSWFTCFIEGQLWRLITYQFVHANVGHLVFNMWALYFFGPAVEGIFGPKRYLLFYLSCGVAGALFSSAITASGLIGPSGMELGNTVYGQFLSSLSPFMPLWQLIPLVGASAAIYGIMVAVAFMFPHARVSLLFPPVTLSMRTLALCVIGIAVFIVLSSGDNAGGEAGHLGGIIMGALIMWLIKKGILRW